MFCKNCGRETTNNQKICENCSDRLNKSRLGFKWWLLPFVGILIQFISPLILHSNEEINGEFIARILGFAVSSIENVLAISLVLSGFIFLVAKIIGKKIGFLKILFIVFISISVLITFFYIKGIQYEMQQL